MSDIPDKRIILLHGVSPEEAMKIMRAVKSILENPKDIIFATTTKHNVSWLVKDLLKEVSQEHDYLKANPPGISGT